MQPVILFFELYIVLSFYFSLFSFLLWSLFVICINICINSQSYINCFIESKGRATWSVKRATWSLTTIAQVWLRHCAGLTTRLTRLQPRAPDFSGAPKRPRPRKGLNEFSLMCEIREIMKIVLVQFYQIYLISLFKYIGMSVTNSNCSCCRLPLSISYIQLCSDSVIPVEKILNSFRTKR